MKDRGKSVLQRFRHYFERYKQKITTYVRRDPYVMKRNDFSTELKD